MSTQTTTQVVYRGHDNRTELLITRYDGRRYVPVDFSAVTRMVLSMPDAQPDPYVFDTSDVPGVIDWSGPPGSVLLNLQDYDVPAGVYVVSLVAYSPEWPNGYVVIDSRPSALGELTFVEFRTVIGSGVLPPPIPGPPAGAIEIRFNGVVVTDSASSIDFTGSVEVEATGGGAVSVNVTGGGGGSGVSSFNTRTGDVTLQGGDVTAALGYTPVNSTSLATVATTGAYADLSGTPSLATVATTGAYADLTGKPTLATVATSGAYADLSGLPTIPSTPGDIGAATAAQGALADSALQPADQASELTMPTARILGRWTSSTGAVQYITLGTNLTLTSEGVLNASGGGGGGGQVDSVGAGTGIAVDATDPTAPIVSLSSAAQASLGKADTALQEDSLATMLAMTSARLLGRWTAGDGKVQQVTIGSGLNLSASGELTATGGGGGQVDTVGAGTGITVDDTDPSAPIVSISGEMLGTFGDIEEALAVINGAAVDPATTEWGEITGTLSDQVDLQAALAAKQEKATLLTVTSTSVTLALTDAGKYLRFTNTAAKTCTVPPQGSVAWADDTEVHVRNAAASDLTLTPGAGVTLSAPFGGTLAVPTGGTVTMKRVGENLWDVIGQTVAA